MPAPPTGRVEIRRGDARRLDGVADASIHLVVTSPPYPMVPQWDPLFRALGAADFAAMHRVLAGAWAECHRVLVPGGILAVNIGDALRSDDGRFQLWPNQAETLVRASRLGFRPLPYLLWKKPTNKPNAFLGSGFLPPNAYVTLDCEFILLFRKGDLRRFPPRDPARVASRFSRAERDRWFSQIWSDVRGARQDGHDGRTAAYPDAIPDRLVRMFSVVGDTVLDPFAGTGTTLWAAARAGRNALGVEWDTGIFRSLVAEARRRGYLTRSAGAAATAVRSRPRSPSARVGPAGRSPRRRMSGGSAARSR